MEIFLFQLNFNFIILKEKCVLQAGDTEHTRLIINT